MKKYIIWSMVMAVVMLVACDPVEDEKGSLGVAPSNLTFKSTPTTDNPNIINFEVAAAGATNARWTMGNGGTGKGLAAVGSYPLAGEYEVAVEVFFSNGVSKIHTEKVTIAETNYAMLTDPTLVALTGGADSVNGKTWVIDKTFKGHMGVGPADDVAPVWWQAGAGDKEGTGLYTDEYNFNINGLAFTHTTGGNVFVNAGSAEAFTAKYSVTLEEAPGGDMMGPYEAASGMTFSIADNNLIISDPGWVGFYTGVNTYEILTISETELYIKFLDAADGGRAWWHRLVPKGFQREIPPKPVKVVEMNETFEDGFTINWKIDEVQEFTIFDNLFKDEVNSSDKLLKYVKGEGEGQMWANAQINFTDLKFDLSERNVFSMKIYMSSANDYETVNKPDWWNVYPSLTPMVALKLQNGEDSEPWVSQVEKVVTISADQMNKWVEVTFDFSEFSDNKSYDRVVLQIGGEGHYMPGTFYIDDFKLN